MAEEDFSPPEQAALYKDTVQTSEQLLDDVRVAAERILARNPEALTGQNDLLRQTAIEAIREKDPTGGVMAQYDALGMPFLADDSHAVPKGVSVLEVQASGYCDSASRVALPPKSPLSSYVVNKVRQLPRHMRNPYATTTHEVAHTINAHGRKKDGKPLLRRMRWTTQNVIDAVTGKRPQYQEMAYRITVETHSIFTEQWLNGDFTSHEKIDDLALDVMWHEHVLSAAWMTPHEASRVQASMQYQNLYIDFRNAIKETGKQPEGFGFNAWTEIYQITKASCKNHLRMVALGMDTEQIGLYLASQPLDRLGEGVYGHTFPTWDNDIVEIAKKKGVVPKSADKDTALAQIDAEIPKVQERIIKECKDYNDALLKAAAVGIVAAKPTEAKREGLTEDGGKILYRSQIVDF